MNYNLFGAALVAGALSACGGSSMQGDPIVGSGELTLAQIGDAATDIYAEYQDQFADESYTDLAGLPDTGSAHFAGVFGFSATALDPSQGEDFDEGVEIDAAAVLGEMTLSLDLATNDLSGDVLNMQYVVDGEQIDGTLAVLARLDRDADIIEAFSIRGTMRGQLIDSEEEVIFETEFSADPFGEDLDAIKGRGAGTITDIATSEDLRISTVFGVENLENR